MAITSVQETWASDLTSSVDDRGWVTQVATRKFDLLSDDPTTDNEDTAKLAAGLPTENSIHPRLGILYRCNNIQVTRTSPILFKAVCKYVTPKYRDVQQAPWLEPAKVDYFPITAEEPIDEDINGDPIVTACGEQFDGITRPVTDLGIRITKAFLSFTPNSFYTYQDAVNSDFFLGFPAGTLRVEGITANENFFNGTVYYDVVVTISARKPYRTTDARAWYKRVIHQGYYARESAGKKPARAVDDNNEPVTRPALLDSDGVKLDPVDPPATITAEWLEWEIFESVAFAGMGLF